MGAHAANVISQNVTINKRVIVVFEKEQDMQGWLSKRLGEIHGLSEIIEDFEEEKKGKPATESRIIDAYNHCLESLRINEVISEDKNISLKLQGCR